MLVKLENVNGDSRALREQLVKAAWTPTVLYVPSSEKLDHSF